DKTLRMLAGESSMPRFESVRDPTGSPVATNSVMHAYRICFPRGERSAICVDSSSFGRKRPAKASHLRRPLWLFLAGKGHCRYAARPNDWSFAAVDPPWRVRIGRVGMPSRGPCANSNDRTSSELRTRDCNGWIGLHSPVGGGWG